MITLLISFLTGIIGPLLPSILNLVRDWQDRKHELAMLEMRMKYAAQEHLWRMEEINARADIEEAKVLHKPQPSFGAQLLELRQPVGRHHLGQVARHPELLALHDPGLRQRHGPPYGGLRGLWLLHGLQVERL